MPPPSEWPTSGGAVVAEREQQVAQAGWRGSRASSRRRRAPTRRGRAGRGRSRCGARASGSITARQFSALPAMPWISSSTGPAPASSVADRAAVDGRRLAARPRLSRAASRLRPRPNGSSAPAAPEPASSHRPTVPILSRPMTRAPRGRPGPPRGALDRDRRRAARLRRRGPAEPPTRPSGEAATSNGSEAPMPDSKPVACPAAAGDAAGRRPDPRDRDNVSGYSLFRVAAVLRIDAGAPSGSGRILCTVKAPGTRTEIAQTSGGLRATYPRSERTGSTTRKCRKRSLIDFSSHGTELAVLEVDDLPTALHHREGRQARMADVQGRHRAPRILPPRRQAEAGPRTALRDGLEDDGSPRGQIACTLTTSAGKATVDRGRAEESRRRSTNSGRRKPERAEEAERQEG